MAGPKNKVRLLHKWNAHNRAVIDPRLNPTDASVFFRLLYHHNSQTGACFPSQMTLAEALNMTDRNVRSSLKKLGDAGYIQKLSQRRGGGSNAYRLNIMEAEENFPKGGKILPKGRKKTSDDTKKEKEKETGKFPNEGNRGTKHRAFVLGATTHPERERGEFQGRLAEMMGPKGDGWRMLQDAPQILLAELEESYLRREVTLEESRDSLLRQIAAGDGPQEANGTGS